MLFMLRLCSAKEKITFQHHNSSNIHINKKDQEKRIYKTKLSSNYPKLIAVSFQSPCARLVGAPAAPCLGSVAG